MTGRATIREHEDAGTSAEESVVSLTAALDAAEQQILGLQRALRTNRTVAMAMGVAMHRWGLTEDEAFAVLRRHSQDGNRKLVAVAAELIAIGELPIVPGSQRRRVSLGSSP